MTEVRPSRVLKDSPVRLLSPDGQSVEMQRIYRNDGSRGRRAATNPGGQSQSSPIAGLSSLATKQPDSPLLPLAIEQLYAGALMQEGLLPNQVT